MTFKTWPLGVLEVILVLASRLFAQTPSPASTPLTISQTDVPIRVDGHLNDWPEARMLYLGRKDQVAIGKNFWKGEDDFSGRVFLTYDQQYLYIAAIVQKVGGIVIPTEASSLIQNGAVVNRNDPISLWNGDCVELFLSTRSNLSGPSHLARGDYHIGLSPGTDCKNPQIYCFNRDEAIPGSRLVARRTLKGYLMEACIPLGYFQGLDLGSGKDFRLDAALDEGGKIGGYRIVQLNYAGKETDLRDPSTWPEAQWTGTIEQMIPVQQSEDLYADLVWDGTHDATYSGVKTVTGIALDPKGKPLGGVLVSTWPKTRQAKTDNQGLFQLPKIKVYNKTVFYGRLDGYVVSLSGFDRHAKAVTLQMSPLPAEWDPSFQRAGSYFFGQSIRAQSPDKFITLLSTLASWVKPLSAGLIRLNLAASPTATANATILLDSFVAFTRQLGAEPMVVVPIDPNNLEGPSQWVRYANGEKGYKIRFWAVGDEPDRGVTGVDHYNAYDYVNHFRMIDNAMKREDPSIVVLGPEVAKEYTRGEDDWITPFLRYDGDIAEGISIHRYATFQTANLAVSIREDLPQEASVIEALRDKIYQNTDYEAPLLVTEESACPAAVTAKTPDEAVTLQFWSALWEAEKKGEFLNEHLAMDISSYPWGSGSAGVSFQPLPAYWTMKLWGQMIHGLAVPAQIQNADMAVYATQDPKSKDVTLMIINKGDRYWRPKTMLNGGDVDLSVDAGLDQRYDYEIPSFSISCLKLKASRSPGEALTYTLKMAKKGQEPQISVIKPW